MQCSPYNNRFINEHLTCFSKKQLLNIVSHLDIKFNKNKTNKDELWQLINKTMLKQDCNHGDEHCWLEKTNKQFDSHVPKQPTEWKSNPNTWLTNFDILNVMTQYEKKYRKFKFFGVFPIDFSQKYGAGQCISQELCDLKISKFKDSDSFGCVFNLDKHNQSGSHWVSVFFNINKNKPNYGFYFYDSVSSKIPKEIYHFGLSIQKQINDNHFKIYQNNVQKQFKNSECGMFSLHFLIECLKKKKYNDIINDKYYDDEVHKLRNKLFRVSK